MDDRSDAVAGALARLAATRAQLRSELLPPLDDDAAAGEGGAFALPRRLRALWRWTRRQLGHLPLGSMVGEGAQRWWREHPWRPAGELVAHELRATAMPLVRRHPLATVLAAGAVGAAIVWWRPWRSPFVRRQMQPLPRRLLRWLLRQLSQAPLQTLVAGMLVSATAGHAAAAAGQAAATHPE